MSDELSASALSSAADDVRAVLPATPQYAWPLVCERLGAEAWVKHENHLPVGAFKVRGGLVLMRRFAREGVRQVVAATRGNHGQSIAFAARRFGIRATVVVPDGNSPEKNAAMRALGAELIVRGRDFQESLELAHDIAAQAGARFVPSFSLDLVRGVASYALELFGAAGALDTVYVPIGLGSGICGVIAARDALGLRTEVVGVVAERADCYARSFAAGRAVATASADTIADGVACRVPNDEALAMILRGAARIVPVGEEEIRAAVRHYFTDTHNVAEGAGAAPLAAAIRERERIRGRRIGLVLSGGNVDLAVFRELAGGT
jgi:threonine dehydratase